MKCDEFLELAWDDPRAGEHARDCSVCAAWMEARLELRAPRAPASLTANVLAQLQPAARPRMDWFMWLWRGLQVAALACYLLLVGTLGYALLQPEAPANLAPRLLIYWAGRADSPPPLDGGL